jgi:class 3 adenylate cyclase
MAKFLRIGVHHSNVSGYTSKAWSVRRVGSAVLLKWGAVRVLGVGQDRKIFWAGPPRQKTVRCGTDKRAKAYVAHAISRRMGHRYERLAESVLIRKGRALKDVELDRELATILFVDIVRSTEKAARMGDRRWSEVMNHYYAAVRSELRAASGREVTTTGDGMLATFKVAVKAIRCASAIRNAVRVLGLEIRAGLHAGEYQMIGGEFVGIAIHIGARVAAKAGAGEVLVSSAVKDLVLKSGIKFKARGVHRLRGVPDRWRLFVVDS